MVNYTIKGFLLVAIPFVVGSAVMSKSLLTLLANAEVADNAFLVTPIVSLGIIFYGLNIIFSNVLFVRLKTAAIFKMNCIAGIVNVGFNLLVFYFMKNILIAAISTFLSYFVAFVFIHRVVVVDWPIDYDRKAIMKSIVASLVMGVVLYLTSSLLVSGSPRFSVVIGEIIIGIVVYCLMIALLRIFSLRELLKLKEFIVQRNR
jgi:O-antigen/teichoic acid export membrane protein